MPDCRACNAPIFWAQTEGGQRIPIDEHEQRDYGPGRYRIVRDQPLTVAAIAEDSPARTYVDHRELCQQPRAM